MKTCLIRGTTKFLALLWLVIWGKAQAAIPASERAVLDALYTQTNGANWSANFGWEGPVGTECAWLGITCTSVNDHVIGIDLSLNHLTGTLPALTALSSLQQIDVSYNQLTGNIPALTSLSSLQVVFARGNQFTGSMPTLTGLSNLQQIYVDGNQLTGSIPALTGLSNLQYFDVDGNQLTGNIPALTGLSNLKILFANDNRLTGSIPPLTGLTNLVVFEVEYNQLTGSIPALAGLSNLDYFRVGGNQLTGSIPVLTGLPNLEQLKVDVNQLTGSIPPLNSLPKLQLVSVSANQLTGSIPPLTGLTNLSNAVFSYNQLTGSIPSLAGLTKLVYLGVANNQLSGALPDLTGLTQLQDFLVGNNGFTGDPPTPPSSLVAGQSSLCNNPLNHTANTAWDTATGVSPWYSTCTSLPSIVTIITKDNPVATGTSTTITATIATPGKALIADTGTSSTVNGTVSDDSGNILCYMTLVNGTGSCNVILPAGSTSNLTGGYSGTTNIAAASATISKTTPVSVSGNLDQHGWTGSWYNPATGGQGIVVEVYPDLFGLGSGLFGAGWFTYDTTAGGEDHKRWYTLQGPVSSTSPTTTLSIVAPTGGNFNAGPVITSNNGETVVGTATLNFTDCQHGTLSYRFTTPVSRQNQLDEPQGNIPLIRGDANVTCDPVSANGNGTTPGTFLLSGAWYNPATSGQGILFDIDPIQGPQGNLFAAWYTYAPNGQAIGGGASQRWYTLQIASANVGATTLSNIGIYSPQGGVLDSPGGVTTPQVGTASVVFTSCNAMTLTYAFTSGTNSGQTGTINLQRVGPTPAGCNL